jgi:hypothetical protein
LLPAFGFSRGFAFFTLSFAGTLVAAVVMLRLVDRPNTTPARRLLTPPDMNTRHYRSTLQNPHWTLPCHFGDNMVI